MSERITKLMDIRELLVHIRAQSSDRQVERDTGFNRRTVKRYREWATGQGLLEGELPSLEGLQVLVAESFQEKTPPQNISSVEKYRTQIETWVKAGLKRRPCASG
jgi:hypothetical protein